MTRNHELFSILLATGACAVAGNVLAAEAVDSGTVTLQEVIVSAQKRDESLQSVPLSITTFSQEKLDLMGVTSLAAVAAALLVGWMVTTHGAVARPAKNAAPVNVVTLADDGRMKLTVTADNGNAGAPARTTRTAAVRSSGGPSLEVALPFAFRP